jgi:NAD(P)-dependent dehydrogenase (short-subunit alcohol dehydrogenase family)
MKSLRDLMDMTGRVAAITGGAGHIGSAMADSLAELGASIVLFDLSSERCDLAADRVHKDYGVRTLGAEIDLSQADSLATVPKIVERQFGRLDVLINCAALVGSTKLQGWVSSFEEQSLSVWRDALEVNLTAPFALAQACYPLLSASGHGSIINVGSIYGLVGPDWSLYEGTGLGNPAAYAASKGGLLNLTRWLATTLAPKVRVNGLSPGGVARNQPDTFAVRYAARTPLGRMATEEDLKGATAYLASDLSAYVTGQNIVVDGGWTAR